MPKVTLPSKRYYRQAEEILQQLKQQPQLDPSLAKNFIIELSNAVRSQIEAEISSHKSEGEQDQEIQIWLASANTRLAANKLAEAKSEIDKVQNLRPNAPELPSLRKRLAAKTAEADRNQKEQVLAGQKQKKLN